MGSHWLSDNYNSLQQIIFKGNHPDINTLSLQQKRDWLKEQWKSMKNMENNQQITHLQRLRNKYPIPQQQQQKKSKHPTTHFQRKRSLQNMQSLDDLLAFRAENAPPPPRPPIQRKYNTPGINKAN